MAMDDDRVDSAGPALGVTVGRLVDTLPDDEWGWAEVIDAHPDRGARLAAAAQATPSPDTLALLHRVEREPLTEAEAVLAMQAAARLEAHGGALKARFAAAVADAQGGPEDWGREEVAAALVCSLAGADQLIEVGRTLRDRLPRLGDALLAGATTFWHTVLAMRASASLDDAQAAALDATIAADAAGLPPARFAARVKRAVAQADPAAFAQRAKEASKGRSVSFYPDQDGQASVVAHGPAIDAKVIYTGLDALAGTSAPGDPRPVAARRFDTLLALVRAALADPAAPRRHGRPVQVKVTMTVDTARGLAERPAELAGYGPIPASQVRRYTASSDWRAFLVDAAGVTMVGLGMVAYQPDQATEDFVIARSQTCDFPSCGQPADRGELDHTILWPHGPTDPTNLASACKRHHRLRHEGGWAVEQHPDGTRSWTSPVGFRYTKPPPDFPVD